MHNANAHSQHTSIHNTNNVRFSTTNNVQYFLRSRRGHHNVMKTLEKRVTKSFKSHLFIRTSFERSTS